MIKDILIVGVGGQGTLLTSRILGELALLNNLDCKLSEVHGMAQRGGSVVTHVRIGNKIHSPIIDEKQADVILAFEKLEGLRYINYLKDDGVLLVSSCEIFPMPVIIGSAKYPFDAIDQAKKIASVVEVDALKIAEQAGNAKTLNVVMIGLLAKYLNIEFECIKLAVTNVVPNKAVEVNLVALEKGYNY